MTRADYIAARIEFARHWSRVDQAWEQKAGPNGQAICSGCRRFAPVVYDSMLQWCEDCYPLAALHSRDTQPKTWPERREPPGGRSSSPGGPSATPAVTSCGG